MSACTTGTCPHGRDAFIWLGNGPWDGDPADPDYGHYPWVHSTTLIPGHLTVCELMPFATPEEAGEVPRGGAPVRRLRARVRAWALELLRPKPKARFTKAERAALRGSPGLPELMKTTPRRWDYL